MSRFHAYIRNAALLLQGYEGSCPLASFLKNYFSQHKKFGSKDRREISTLCYQFFRLGRLTDKLSVEEGLLAADYIFRGNASEIIKNLRPDWYSLGSIPLEQRVEVAGLHLGFAAHTPWFQLVQPEIPPPDFVKSHFLQPDLFVRVRPGKMKKVCGMLEKAGVGFCISEGDGLRLPNGTGLEPILKINRDIVVQDWGSQKCGAIIKFQLPHSGGLLWDACAASGGKSIMMHDLYSGQFRIAASDIRPTILQNLRKRYAEAGVPADQIFVADLTKPLANKGFLVDVALVDAPCTGSGTWARTPEQHYYFNPESLQAFTDRQFLICKNVLDKIKTGGYLIYITCSVFNAENHGVINRLASTFSLKAIHEEIINGTLLKADSMYIAILQKI